MFDKRSLARYYTLIIEQIRTSLINKNGRELLIFLFFVFLSFSFWLLQTLNDTYETELSVPIRLSNVPSNVVVTQDLPSELKMVVVDKGTVLINYLLGHSLHPIAIDFDENSDEGESVWFSSASLARRVNAQLYQTTKITSILPDSLGYIYTRGEARQIAIKVAGDFTTQRQYYISDISCSPDSVLVYAPKAILDTLTAIYTEPIERHNISDSMRIEVGFLPIKGVRISESSCQVAVDVDIYAEKTVEVPITGLNFPSDKLLRTFPSKVQVTFQIGLNYFKTITSDDFFIGVEYEDLVNSTTGKCRVKLQSLPHFVSYPRISPSEIDFLIEPRIIKEEHD